MLVARQLLAAKRRVIVYDPAAMENARRALDGDVVFASSMEACAAEAAVLAIATPWEQFKALRPEHLRRSLAASGDSGLVAHACGEADFEAGGGLHRLRQRSGGSRRRNSSMYTANGILS